MALKLYGSHMCPNTLYAINQLKSKNIEFDFINASGSLADLKAFIKLRENTPEIFDKVRENDKIGFPCFIKDDGTVTNNINDVL